MHYQNITVADMKNGDGLRTVLWVSGCLHHCKGCHNPITWDSNDGLPFTVTTIEELLWSLKPDWCSGLTLSGGDPLHPDNLAQITALCSLVKSVFPNKTIWCYTGYLFEEISELDIMKYIDVLVDGEFDCEKLDVTYPWAGSTNQRVIDVQQSLSVGSVILHAGV